MTGNRLMTAAECVVTFPAREIWMLLSELGDVRHRRKTDVRTSGWPVSFGESAL